MPDSFGNNKHARAYYGAFRLALGEGYFEQLRTQDGQALVDEALVIDSTVKRAVAEHSVNPRDIESEIRRSLLPRLFDLVGVDHAKALLSVLFKSLA